jgi:uncharacterized membrane protein
MEMNATTVIRQPVDKVFAYVSDVSNDVHWRTGITESGLDSDQPLGPESTGFARAGNVEARWRVTSYEAGRRVDWDLVSGPLQGRGGYRLVPVDAGTEFTLVADIEPGGVFKLMGPLFAWMGKRRNQADVEKLRDILESTSN